MCKNAQSESQEREQWLTQLVLSLLCIALPFSAGSVRAGFENGFTKGFPLFVFINLGVQLIH
jgi:hypothetical protein